MSAKQGRTSAIRGVAPKTCPNCKRKTTEKDYRWRPSGACHRTCKWCEDRVRRAKSAERKRIREARTSWSIWKKVIDE